MTDDVRHHRNAVRARFQAAGGALERDAADRDQRQPAFFLYIFLLYAARLSYLFPPLTVCAV